MSRSPGKRHHFGLRRCAAGIACPAQADELDCPPRPLVLADRSGVAQLVEQTAVNRRVGGSSPPSGAQQA
jgi:hypothetical protein